MKNLALVTLLALVVGPLAFAEDHGGAAHGNMSAAEHMEKAGEHHEQAAEHMKKAATHKKHAAKKMKKNVRGADKADK